ncbi:MAG: 30S ribosomal protein S16 [Candidatus Andersenbacteria bacterium]|nr:30S ribosomal protein S16 [Candidatus Andersenbacteria bacterium]
MLRIRLSRVGKKNKAQFRVTVADARRSPTGKFIEILGHYNPHTKEKVFKNERIEYWISKGAKPSPTVHNLFIDAGIIKGEKVTSWKPKKKEKGEGEKAKETKTEEKKKEETQPEKEEVKSEKKEAPKAKVEEKKEEK